MTKHISVVISSDAPDAAGAEMAAIIFKSAIEQGCVESATRLLIGLVSGGVGVLEVVIGQAETLNVLAALAKVGNANANSSHKGVH